MEPNDSDIFIDILVCLIREKYMINSGASFMCNPFSIAPTYVSDVDNEKPTASQICKKR